MRPSRQLCPASQSATGLRTPYVVEHVLHTCGSKRGRRGREQVVTRAERQDTSRRTSLVGLGAAVAGLLVDAEPCVAEGLGARLLSRGGSTLSTLEVPTVQLASGHQMPLFGLGTYALPPEHTAAAVKSALESGYRHIDTAVTYRNEAAVGEALSEFLRSKQAQRSDLFVTTKLWSNQHGIDQVEPAVRESLSKLHLEYLDLLLIHWPVSDKPAPQLIPSAQLGFICNPNEGVSLQIAGACKGKNGCQETWAAMEAVVDKGLVRSIGVSNFSPEKIKAWLSSSRVPVSVNQVEAHPHWRNDRVLDFCRREGIHMTAYAPLSSPGQMARKGEDVPNLLKEKLVVDIAAKHGKTPSQVLLAWGIQRGTSVIPKASSAGHQKENAGCLGWALPQEDFQALSSIQWQRRYFLGSGFMTDQGPWHNYEELWDEKEPA